MKRFIAHPARQGYWYSAPASMASFTAARIIRFVNIKQAPARNAGSDIWIRIKGSVISSATTRVAGTSNGNARVAEQGGWLREMVHIARSLDARITAVKAVAIQQSYTNALNRK